MDIILFQSTQPEWAATGVRGQAICDKRFQSTQPEWAATFLILLKWVLNHYFNPRSPSGLRLCL